MSDQVPKENRTYTEDEIEHILDRRMTNVQLEQLTNRVTYNESANSEMFNEIRSTLKALNESVSDGTSRLYQTRKELRDEIEIDFVTKALFNSELKRLEALLQSQWQKITLAVTVAIVAVQLGFQLLGGAPV